jgi:hypothetical protein
MEKLIEVFWENKHGETVTGDAIVEFARYNDDGVVINEITCIFLPEGLQPSQVYEVKQQATEAFHHGEGYNL